MDLDSFPVKVGVKHETTIHGPKYLSKNFNGKHGSKIYNATYLDAPATVVQEDYTKVFGRTIKSEHVLRCQGSAGDGLTIYDDFVCTLEDVLNIKKDPKNYDIINLNCTEEQRVVINEMVLVRDNGNNGCRHTEVAVKVASDLICACAEVRARKLHHGDLTVKNIVICIDEQGVITAKLWRLKGGNRSDYRSLGKVFELLFSCPTPPGEKGGIRMSYEAEDLYKYIMVQYGKNNAVDASLWRAHQLQGELEFEKNPRVLLKHVLFWTPDMCLNFIFQVRVVLKRCRKHPFNQYPEVTRFLQQMDDISRSDWFVKLSNDVDVTAELYSNTYPRKALYSRVQTVELLRFIRNMFSHFEEKSKDFKDHVGDLPDGFFEFFRSRYPDLLVETRRVLIYNLEDIRNLADISYNFEIYA